MNFKCEPLIWQTWSDKWGSWDNWFHATGQGQLPEASSRKTQPPGFRCRPRGNYPTREVAHEKIRTIELHFVD